ncbi:hypothetical protein GEMRC1_008029 [Eukaryota sp. GEM-RC1]
MHLAEPLIQLLKLHLTTIQNAIGADIVLVNHFVSEDVISVLVSSQEDIIPSGTEINAFDAFCCCVRRIRNRFIVVDAAQCQTLTEDVLLEEMARPFRSSGFKQYMGYPCCLGGFGNGTVCCLKKETHPLLTNDELLGLGSRMVSLEILAWYPPGTTLNICSRCGSSTITHSVNEPKVHPHIHLPDRPENLNYPAIEVPHASSRVSHTICLDCLKKVSLLSPQLESPMPRAMEKQLGFEELLTDAGQMVQQVHQSRLKQPYSALVADDSAAIRMVMKKLLESQSIFNVIPAENGEEALEILKQQNDDLTIAFIDEVMPHMRGSECVREYRSWEFKNFGDTKAPLFIVSITGFKSTRLRSYLKTAGFNDVLYKPLTKKMIERSLDEATELYLSDLTISETD